VSCRDPYVTRTGNRAISRMGHRPTPRWRPSPALNSGHRDTRATAWFGGDPMFDLLYVILIIVLLAISIAMIRFFERL